MAAKWQFQPIHEYRVPQPAAGEAVHGGLRKLWRWLRPDQTANGIPEHSCSLTRLTQSRLDALMPALPWKEMAEALRAHVPDLARGESRVVVGPPGAGVAECLTQLAQNEQWNIVSPPDRSELVAADASELFADNKPSDTAGDAHGPLVIPHLERWLLRHHRGLDRFRKALDKLLHHDRGLVIGCDSWAWAYLGRTLRIDGQLPTPLVLAPCDAELLENWLRPVDDQFQVLISGSRKQLYCRGDQDNSKKPGADEHSRGELAEVVLHELAVLARGIPGIAWSLWQHALRVEDPDEKSASEESESSIDPHTVFMVHPRRLELPAMGARPPAVQRILLHSLLIHGGLSRDILPALMPFGHDQTARAVHELRSAGIIEYRTTSSEKPLLCVAPLAYSKVREQLRHDGLLTDDF